MVSLVPPSIREFMNLPWSQIEPYYRQLLERPLDQAQVAAWLEDWSQLARLLNETSNRLYVATTVNTEDEVAERRYQEFLDEIYPSAQAWDQQLKEKLIASGLQPTGFEVPLRNMRAEVDLFEQSNLPLLAEELKLGLRYAKVVGAQTVEWEGEERTISQLRPVQQDFDRERRERAWRLASSRQLADRQVLNALWQQLLPLRQRIAENAGKKDYRDYQWQRLLRFAYSPQDCLRFHDAIEQVVVPAARRVYEKRQHQLGVPSLRPWDLEVDPLRRPPLRPFLSVDQLKETTSRIFNRLDQQFGKYFDTMRQEGLLDLENRKAKAPGGYCTDFYASRRPFIFMNAVGLHDDVQTLLHESGHAFHFFESSRLPYYQQMQIGSEIAEVASMGMELLASPYLTEDKGGFYDPTQAARARIEHLEGVLLFWPYMAVVDAFQHWVYEHPGLAIEPDNCDATWSKLWDRFMVGVDWSGLEEEKVTGWQRKLHIFEVPFYYVEYGLAQLGAVQVWRNALQDQAQAVEAYRQALALGGTRPLPDLYAAAGARFAMDADTLRQAVDLLEQNIHKLEAVG